MIEVELKFEITPAVWPQVDQFLTQTQFMRQVWNLDRYYDTADFNLLNQAVFVRMRNKARLEFKFNEQAELAHTHCTEYTFSLVPEPEPARQMNALFSRFLPGWRYAKTVHEAIARNRLCEMARIENYRMQYALEDAIVSIDRVKELGDFLEMEIECREEWETQQSLMRLEGMVAGIALRTVRVGYVELWLQKYYPHIYQRGKYREDPLSSSGAG